MTNFEKATELVTKEIMSDLRSFREYEEGDVTNWQEMLDWFGIDSSEMKENIYWMLKEAANNGEIEWFFTDALEIEDNGSFKTYRQLTNAVRKQLFE